MAAEDQTAWYDVWGKLNRAAADLDAAVRALESQRAYALARPGLRDDWQAKMAEIETARGRVTWLRDTIRSVMSFLGVGLSGVSGLGFLPLIPIAGIAAGVAYVASLAASAWELSKKIEEQRRLESRGLSPQQASAIVSRNADAGTGLSTTQMLMIGGALLVGVLVLPKLFPGGR